MAIIIRNLDGNPTGVCKYEVRINEKRITTFKHNRTDGLAKCLFAASKAVEKQKLEYAINIFQDVSNKEISRK